MKSTYQIVEGLDGRWAGVHRSDDGTATFWVAIREDAIRELIEDAYAREGDVITEADISFVWERFTGVDIVREPDPKFDEAKARRMVGDALARKLGVKVDAPKGKYLGGVKGWLLRVMDRVGWGDRL